MWNGSLYRHHATIRERSRCFVRTDRSTRYILITHLDLHPSGYERFQGCYLSELCLGDPLPR